MVLIPTSPTNPRDFRESFLRVFLRLCCGAILLGLAGCGTTQGHRATFVWDELKEYPVAERQAASVGIVREGFSETLVYVAYGEPDEVVAFGGGFEDWFYVGKSIELIDPATGRKVTGFRTRNNLTGSGGFTGKVERLRLRMFNGHVEAIDRFG